MADVLRGHIVVHDFFGSEDHTSAFLARGDTVFKVMAYRVGKILPLQDGFEFKLKFAAQLDDYVTLKFPKPNFKIEFNDKWQVKPVANSEVVYNLQEHSSMANVLQNDKYDFLETFTHEDVEKGKIRLRNHEKLDEDVYLVFSCSYMKQPSKKIFVQFHTYVSNYTFSSKGIVLTSGLPHQLSTREILIEDSNTHYVPLKNTIRINYARDRHLARKSDNRWIETSQFTLEEVKEGQIFMVSTNDATYKSNFSLTLYSNTGTFLKSFDSIPFETHSMQARFKDPITVHHPGLPLMLPKSILDIDQEVHTFSNDFQFRFSRSSVHRKNLIHLILYNENLSSKDEIRTTSERHFTLTDLSFGRVQLIAEKVYAKKNTSIVAYFDLEMLILKFDFSSYSKISRELTGTVHYQAELLALPFSEDYQIINNVTLKKSEDCDITMGSSCNSLVVPTNSSVASWKGREVNGVFMVYSSHIFYVDSEIRKYFSSTELREGIIILKDHKLSNEINYVFIFYNVSEPVFRLAGTLTVNF